MFARAGLIIDFAAISGHVWIMNAHFAAAGG
jgi:hypothetical protein